MKLSAVIPTINEGRTIGHVIDGLKALGDIEIIVVDSDSTDNTKEIAQLKGAKVINEQKKGYGVAYKRGLREVTGDIIICMDGDGTYPTEIVRPLIELLEIDNVDFVSGERLTLRTSRNYTTLHYVGNTVLNKTISFLFKYELKDSQSGLWVFRKRIYDQMTSLSDGMSFSQDIKIEAIRLGKLIEVPINYGVRATKSNLRTWRDGLSNLFYIFVKRVNT